MLKILTVFKTGGIYEEYHVLKIKNMLEKYVNIPYEFICLTDIESTKYKTMKLSENAKSWFSKLELFQINGPCFYIDLDTIICGNIDKILRNCLESKSSLITLNDPVLRKDYIGSGIMFWRADLNTVFEEFKNNTEKYLDPKTVWGNKQALQPFGDQNVLRHILKQYDINYSFFQEQCQSIVSFKINIDHGRKFDRNKHKIVYFHGKPRPWEQEKIEY